MNHRNGWFLLSLTFCFGLTAQAQWRTRIDKPGDAPDMAPPDRAAILGQLTTAAAELEANPPEFACRSFATSFRRSVNIDFAATPPAATSNDWDRFRTDVLYRGFVESKENQKPVTELMPVLRELFAETGQMKVDYWMQWKEMRVAVVRDSNADREASIFVDPNSGSIVRIALRAFPSRSQASSLQCWAARK